MKKRTLSLILALTLLFSLATPSFAEDDFSAEENTTEFSEAVTDEAEDEPENAEEILTPEETITPADPVETQEPAEENEDESVTSEVTDKGNEVDLQEATECTATLELSSEQTISLCYDDDVDFSTLADGYVVAQVKTLTVTSFQVSGGCVSSEQDTDVLQPLHDSETVYVATGIGTAEVLLVPAEQKAEAQAILDETCACEEDLAIPAIKVTVTVTPATLTLMLLGGQSNMEGYCSASTGYQTGSSVQCERGQVYSTYAAKTDETAVKITGISGYTACGLFNVNAVVAGSLGNGAKAIDGSELVYPLNALTQDGNGKTGPDSGLAWEWNQLTDEKVWAVNAAAGSSAVGNWSQGGDCYERAMAVYTAAYHTWQAELQAGHYSRGHVLMFWLQGENDKNRNAAMYLDGFQSMYSGFRDTFGIEACGMISVRASTGSYTNSADIAMTGPRIAQYYMGGSNDYYGIYMVSTVNEQWVTNTGVSTYFRTAYPDGALDYPMHAGASTALPATVVAVHSDIHYSQIAHNENGIDAARNLYEAMFCNPQPTQAVVLNTSGTAIRSTQTSVDGITVPVYRITTTIGTETTVCLSTVPVAAAKNLSLEYDSAKAEYNAESGGLYVFTAGTTDLQLKDQYGNLIGVIRVTAASTVSTPKISTIENTETGIKLTWTGGTTGFYYIYRKTGTGQWKLTADSVPYAIVCHRTEYTDTAAEPGVTYSYAIRGENGETLGKYVKAGASCTRLLTPKLNETAYSSGVKISWDAVTGAKSYDIYRHVYTTGVWSKIGSTSSLTYTDKSAPYGEICVYTVRAVRGSSMSAYDIAGVSGVRLATPKLIGAVNQDSCILFTWNSVTGATSYNVYRKTAGASIWGEPVAVVTGTSYEDTDITPGGSYTYTVRPLHDGNLCGDFDKSGKQVYRLEAASVTKAQGTSGKISLSWNAVNYATSYKVYRKTETSGWSALGTTKTTDYTDSKAKTGIEYTYMVRAVRSSSYGPSTGGTMSAVNLATPTLVSLKNAPTGIQLTWKEVPLAEYYVVMRKLAGEKWSKAVETIVSGDVTLLDENVESGVKYVYSVRAYCGIHTSGYNSTGLTMMRIGQPQMLTAEAIGTGKGIRLTWTEVANAKTYAIYRRTAESTKWSKISTVKAGITSLKDTTAKAGVTYYYTVRAYNGSYSSAYDTTGIAGSWN